MAKLSRASGITPEAVEWLWRERIPRGMITTIAGRPDQGKGLLSIHVAAEIAMAGGKVLHSAAEDSRSLMTVPRYIAAIKNGLMDESGADVTDKQVKEVLERICFWDFVMPQQLGELDEIVAEEKIDLIVMDPFNAHLGKGVSRFSDSLRPVLGELKTIAEKNRLSVVIVEHALKRVPKTGHPLDAIGGTSSGLPAASRAAFVFGVDPDDPDKRVMAPAKFNIGEKPKAMQLLVDITDVAVVGTMPFLDLEDDWELKAFDPMRLFAGDPKKAGAAAGRPDDKRAAACEWLTTHLATYGKMKSSKVQEDAKQNGMSVKTLRRAADDMEIVKHPKGGGRNCTWDLPDDVKKMMGIAVVPKKAPAKPKAKSSKPQKASEVSLEEGLAELLGGGASG